MEPILEIESLKKYYGKNPNQTKALDGITFQVMPGEFLGIMGSSGSGKSTLLNCIAAVTRPGSGSIMMKGRQVLSLSGAELADYRGREIGYLFQNFELLDNLTGRENILLPLSLHGVPEKESGKRLEELALYFEVTGHAASWAVTTGKEMGRMMKREEFNLLLNACENKNWTDEYMAEKASVKKILY